MCLPLKMAHNEQVYMMNGALENKSTITSNCSEKPDGSITYISPFIIYTMLAVRAFSSSCSQKFLGQV